ISGGLDSYFGGRRIVRYNYFQDAHPNGHGTEGGNVRGMRCEQIYENTIKWDGTPSTMPSPQSIRGGGSMWHDNTFLGPNSDPASHSVMLYYREFNGITEGIHDLNGWGLADGTNGWDKNDPHGLYFSDTATSGTTISGGNATFAVGTNMVSNAYRGMQVRNDNPA